MVIPLNRLYLSHTLSEPRLGADALYYVRQADGRKAIYRQALGTGLSQAVTTEPPPSGGVGYGGALYAVRDNVLIYAGRDGRLHGLNLTTGEQWAVTPTYEGVAGPAFSPDGRFVAFLAEQDGRCNVLLVDVRGATLPVKLSDNPWYAFNPTFAPDGLRLAWMEWDEFAMPWDESRVVVAQFAQPVRAWGLPAVAANPLPLMMWTLAQPGYAYSGPQFSPDGEFLAYASDESGWRSLWVTPVDKPDLRAAAVRLDLGPGEIGEADWVPGQMKFGWAEDGRALYTVRRHLSRAHLLRVAWPEQTVTEIETGYSWLTGLHVNGDQAALLAGRPSHPDTVIVVDVPSGVAVARATSAVGVYEPAALIEPRIVEWPTAGAGTASGIFYPARVPAGESGPRPLLVLVHGGPTSERGLTWDAPAQYWATRGWHYVLINHRGGSGFGRDFQHQLDGQWGVVDVQDARAAAEYLVSVGLADPQRLVITGTSAGGFTTLMALTQDPEFWAAGISTAGIGEHYEVMVGSHRFEKHYETTLIGRLPQAGPLWKARSPLTHVRAVRKPVLLFHGRDDKVVPVQQSIDYAEAVRRQGGVAELVLYDGEGHGVAQEANRRDQIERMERFLDKYVLALQ